MKTTDSTGSQQADKRTLYKTARARISCALFKAGDIVGVKYSHQSAENGTVWYDVTSQKGEVTAYPIHHLTDFVL